MLQQTHRTAIGAKHEEKKEQQVHVDLPATESKIALELKLAPASLQFMDCEVELKKRVLYPFHRATDTKHT